MRVSMCHAYLPFFIGTKSMRKLIFKRLTIFNIVVLTLFLMSSCQDNSKLIQTNVTPPHRNKSGRCHYV